MVQGAFSGISRVRKDVSFPFACLACVDSSTPHLQHLPRQDMGSRLAKEVAGLLVPYITSCRRPLSALSFVCHSMGNLIMRAALTCPEMEPFLPYLHLFVSICGPHLGQMYSANAMLDAGAGAMGEGCENRTSLQAIFVIAATFPHTKGM